MSNTNIMKEESNENIIQDKKIINENLSESLDSIALNNLSLLVKEENNPFTNNRFILQKNKMIENDDENIDIVYSLNDLENTIYFTFNQCMNILSHSETDVYIMLHSLFNALDVVEEYYNERKDTSLYFENILDDTENKLMNHKNNYYNKNICSKFMRELGNKIHNILMDASQEVFKFHWHYHSFDSYEDSEDSEDTDDSEDSDVKDKEC